MAGPGEITNSSQPFKLTIERFSRPTNAANGAANAPQQLANAQPAANPQPVVAQAQPRRGILAWIAGLLGFASPAPAPAPRVVPATPSYVTANANIVRTITSSRFDQLPQEVQTGFSKLVTDLRGVFGAAAVPEGASLDKVLHPMHVQDLLGALRDAANAQERVLTAPEIVAAYAQKACERLAITTLGTVLLEKAKARDPDIAASELSFGAQFNKLHPGLCAEINRCKNPDEIAAAFQRHEAEINLFVDVAVRSAAASKAAEGKAVARLAAATGLDAGIVAMHVPMDLLRAAARDLTSQIQLGEAPGSREPGYNVEAAYDAVVDEFVQKRASAYAAVDALDIPENLKARWKAEFTGYREVPMLTPAQLLEIAGAIDVKRLETAFSKTLPMKIAVETLHNITNAIKEAAAGVTGNEHIFDNAGADDMMPIYGMLIAFAESKSQTLATAIQAARDTFLAEADSHCEANPVTLAPTAMFVKSLIAKGGTVKQIPFTNEEKYLAAVKAEAEAALAKAGIKNAKVLGDVAGMMVKRGKVAFAGTTGLSDLSGVLVAVREQSAEIGKTLEAIMKARASAKSVIATTISASASLGKAYVMNNLATARVASDSGKLRFLYDGVLDKARKGEAIDHSATLNKASEIISKYAFEKIAILKELDKAGFDPAELAAHKALALRDGDWSDPSVVTVAKAMAENATMKNATRLLAGALKSENLATLDDAQLRDVFLVFGKAYMTTLLNEFKEQVEKWGGSVDMTQRFVTMMFQFLTKEHPDLPAAFARLVASGRFANARTLISDEMNAIHSRRMDYELLAQYNLMGAPAGEKIRSVMNDPDLAYDAAAYEKCMADDLLCNMTSTIMTVLAGDFPTKGTFDAEKYIAFKTKGSEVIAKYAGELTQETLPILAKLVATLDWRGAEAAQSEEIVKNYVADMKAWRDVAPGSADSKGLEEVAQRRINNYFKDVYADNKKFNTEAYPGIFQTFLDDLPRCKYVINGRTVLGNALKERMSPFMSAIKDPAKRRAVSVMTNQQLFGDHTASVANRIPFAGWKAGMQDEPVGTIPGIEKFASRDISKTGLQLFDTGPMEYAIDVAPDESTVTVHAKSTFPLHADITLPAATVGTCVVTQDFVIDFTGAEPVIRDVKIGQALSA